MRRVLLLILLGLLAAAPASAQVSLTGIAACIGFDAQLVPFAGEQITVSTTAVGFTAATYAPAGATAAAMALVTIEAQPLRFRVDGTNPTSAVGHLRAANDSIVVCGPAAIAAFRAIRQGASDATIFVTYLRSR